MKNIHNGRHAAAGPSSSWWRKKMLGVPLVLAVPLLAAGLAAAAWLLTTEVGFSGSGTTEAAGTPIVLNLASASAQDNGTTQNLTCSASVVDAESFTLTIEGADVDFNGADTPSDDRCLVSLNVNIASGYYLNGVGLVVDGGAANDPVAPFYLEPVGWSAGGPQQNSTDLCEPGATGPGVNVEFYVTLSELNSSPNTVYAFAGSTVEAGQPGDPCISAGV